MTEVQKIDTAVATDELDRSLVSGIAWTAALRWVAQAVSWAGTLYAARILTPGDYGIAAAATLPIGLVRMVEDFGLDAVLVQDRRIEGQARAQLAGFALLLASGLAIGFFVAAQPIAAFFKEPLVATAIQLMCPLVLLDALQIVPRALLQRELAYRRLAILGFVQVCVTQVALIVAARAGLGYQSLVFNTLAGGTIVTAVLLYWRPYALRMPRDWRAIAAPIAQGWRLLMSRAAWYAYSNTDQTIVGRLLGKELLGAYSFATTFANLPIQEITSAFSRVVPGVFSTVQHDRAQLRRYFFVLTEVIALLAIPSAVGLALVAEPLVALALGPQWAAVVAPLRILCAAAAFTAVQVLVSHVLMWTGRFRANMWCTFLAAAALPGALYFGAGFSVAGVAWAMAIGLPIVNLPAIVIAARIMQASPRLWLRALLPAILCSAAMAAGVLAEQSTIARGLSTALSLTVQIATGAAIYVAALLIFYRERVLALVAFVRGTPAASPVEASPSG
ncbi:MAG TPA: lipopolysaccharide biosynthesis protein [Steroidobacteraceae bacterium]|nr:lipopolysaccharide biosynthesis protein [Steroidobacteraceae bacterium]